MTLLDPRFRAAAVVAMDRAMTGDPRHGQAPSDVSLRWAFTFGHHTATVLLAQQARDLAYTAPGPKE